MRERLKHWQHALERISSNIPAAEVKAWRHRVERLAREIEARAAAGDILWFDWLEEYGYMRAETLAEEVNPEIEMAQRAYSAKLKRAAVARTNRIAYGARTADKVRKGLERRSDRQERRIRAKARPK